MRRHIVTAADLARAAFECALCVIATKGARAVTLYGVPRGGVPAALSLLPHLPAGSRMVDTADAADVIVDDLIDSGATARRYRTSHPRTLFTALFVKEDKAEWLVFPWDETDVSSGEDIVVRLLQFIGEDPTREGLRETPRRVLKAWGDWTAGYGQAPGEVLKVFEDGAERVDEMVLVKDIPVYSHCEHHLAPFFGKAHVAYIPNGRVLGLSKIVRLVNIFAKRLQVQERLTQQVAHALNDALHPQGVAVVLECRHLCMESRGVQTVGASTTTSCLLGAIKEEPSARAEFMRLVR